MHESDMRKEAESIRGGYMGGAGSAGTAAAPGMLHQAREQTNDVASEGLRSRAFRQAHQKAHESARLERFAERMTPEIETALWCFQEAAALGLLDVEALIKSGYAARERERARY